jgi:hypothetical protein
MDILFGKKRGDSIFETPMKRLLGLLTLAILNVAILGGCTGGWTKAGMTHSQLRTDVASCKFQVRRMVEEGKIPYERDIMKQKLNECLINKGYQQSKEGEDEK